MPRVTPRRARKEGPGPAPTPRPAFDARPAVVRVVQPFQFGDWQLKTGDVLPLESEVVQSIARSYTPAEVARYLQIVR
jgi:hypothetical protein